MAEFMISARNIRRGEFGAEPGKTRFLVVPSRRLPKPSHAVRRREWARLVTDEATADSASCDAPGAGDVLVFVHGYNNDPPTVVKRHRTLAGNLKKAGYKGAVVSFDWPSNDIGLNYLEDRSDARKTAIRLVDDCITLLATMQRGGCWINVHLLAHSTGAYVVREGFDDADDRRRIAAVSWAVSQIVFIGADVSSKSMSSNDSKSSSIYRHCSRLTNYQNPYDSILKLSNIKRIGVAPRVGRIGLPESAPQKAVNVNTGPYFTALKEKDKVSDPRGHSWHFEDRGFAKDLVHTLRGDIDRNYVPTRKRGDGGELVLAP